MNVRLFELFTSIEGEGLFCGTKTLFVRLAGCPFTCFYCDTLDALPLDSGNEYSIEQAQHMIDDALQSETFKVNFTGGDPLVQHEAVAILAKYVQSKNIKTYLESSCFDSEKFAHILPFIDYSKIEFKTIDSEFVKHDNGVMINTALKCLELSLASKATTFIKIVVSARTRKETIKDLTVKIFSLDTEKLVGIFIQPTFGIEEPSLELLVEFYDIIHPFFSQVRIIPQLHKFMHAP